MTTPSSAHIEALQKLAKLTPDYQQISLEGYRDSLLEVLGYAEKWLELSAILVKMIPVLSSSADQRESDEARVNVARVLESLLGTSSISSLAMEVAEAAVSREDASGLRVSMVASLLLGIGHSFYSSVEETGISEIYDDLAMSVVRLGAEPTPENIQHMFDEMGKAAAQWSIFQNYSERLSEYTVSRFGDEELASVAGGPLVTEVVLKFFAPNQILPIYTTVTGSTSESIPLDEEMIQVQEEVVTLFATIFVTGMMYQRGDFL